MSGQPSTPPPAARVDADWEEVLSEAKVLQWQWQVNSKTNDEKALEAATKACAKLEGAMGGPERDPERDQWLASAYAAAADSLASLTRGRSTQPAGAQSHAAMALCLCRNHPHALLVAAKLCVMDTPRLYVMDTPRLNAAKKLLNEMGMVHESCFRADVCAEAEAELKKITTQLKNEMETLLLMNKKRWLMEPEEVLKMRNKDVLRNYGKTKAGTACGLTVAELAALGPNDRTERGVKDTAYNAACKVRDLLSCTRPVWLSTDKDVAFKALKNEALEAHMRVLCWNLQATKAGNVCRKAKATTLAELLGDQTLGCPAVAVLQECPLKDVLCKKVVKILGEDWGCEQTTTGDEGAGFVYDKTRVECLLPLQTFNEGEWPKDRPPVLALFRTCKSTPPTLLAFLSVHLAPADGGEATMAREQLQALSKHVLPWAQREVAKAAGKLPVELPVAFLVLGDFNLHGPKDKAVVAARTNPGIAWTGLIEGGFRSLLPADSPSNIGLPITKNNYSYDHVWAQGVQPWSSAYVHRPLGLDQATARAERDAQESEPHRERTTASTRRASQQDGGGDREKSGGVCGKTYADARERGVERPLANSNKAALRASGWALDLKDTWVLSQ